MFRRVAISVNRVPIWLIPERWNGLCVCEDEALEAIAQPDYLLMNREGAFVACRELMNGCVLCVTYVEFGVEEGYILSARCATRVDRQAAIWVRRY